MLCERTTCVDCRAELVCRVKRGDILILSSLLLGPGTIVRVVESESTNNSKDSSRVVRDDISKYWNYTTFSSMTYIINENSSFNTFSQWLSPCKHICEAVINPQHCHIVQRNRCGR